MGDNKTPQARFVAGSKFISIIEPLALTMSTGITTAPAHSENRIYGLDILRSFAILSVVYSHGYTLLEHNGVHLKNYGLIIMDGVTVFFVLSGFLIGGIFLKIFNKDPYDEKKLLGFWIRRWFRTLPNYFLFLVVLIISYYLTGKALPATLYKYFFFFQNFHDRHPSFFGEAWSLSVEEWFYLIVPFVISATYLLFRLNKRYVVLFWIFFIMFSCTAIRIYRVYVHGYVEEDAFDFYIRKQVVTRLDSLMYGVLAAYVAFYHKQLFIKYQNILFFIGCILIISPKLNEYIFDSAFYNSYLLLTITPLGSMLVLPKAANLFSGKGFLHKFFTLISKISYSMYLIHASFLIIIVFPLINQVLGSVISNNGVLAGVDYVLYWALVIAGSWVIYTYYEYPITNLRDKVKFDKG